MRVTKQEKDEFLNTTLGMCNMLQMRDMMIEAVGERDIFKKKAALYMQFCEDALQFSQVADFNINDLRNLTEEYFWKHYTEKEYKIFKAWEEEFL